MNPAAFIVPAFFIFVGLEYWLARKKGKEKLYSYEESITNISVGIAERLLSLLITGSFYALYYYVYEHFAIYQIPNHWSLWVILLLATDLVWYWYHRLGHEINLFWGAHIVHHQSEEFNYTVSARITVLQALVRNVFWCILPFIGFHPAMVITILVVHGTYAFFTHTQLIGKLGWLEYIFITPTHHGVHHASNEKYLNKNYGDIFVFWDKLFGTFQREEEKPQYGLTHPLKSHSFLWQHFHYYAELWEACRRSGSIWKSVKIVFGRPEDLDQRIRPVLERKLLPNKTSPQHTFRFRAYLNLQIICALAGLFAFTLFYNQLDMVETALGIFIILLTLINCGAMLEQQRWIYFLEITRAILIIGYVCYGLNTFNGFTVSVLVLLGICSIELVERRYYQFVYTRKRRKSHFNNQSE
jgi:alkylglycerol monooxygenase